ncbi:hypothetical protein [Neorhizobium galegae]|uniref:hypothetical protein n=1 Tax=Neorhizobium galegae TaxID=399 RepID=UPI0020C8107D|nr:hypothetical protein [Neorhizobium galegae]
MAAPQSKPIHRHWFNPSIARYMEAFTTTRGIAALTVIILISTLAFLAPLIFPGGYDIQSRESLRRRRSCISSAPTNSAAIFSCAASTG